jgi:peptidoglycan hydrolase-like protein with peptidoglycan-binding domain
MKRLLALLALLLPLCAEAQTPQSCAAFTPEISCNAATGLPVVTLSNSLAGSFDPTQIKITSLTAGVQATPNPANPLALQLTGASAGQTVLLDLAALATGAGSAEGLDKCCMGELSVTIPPDFTCQRPPLLSLSNICTAEPASAETLDVTCEIALHFEGSPPAPLTLSAAQTGPGWSLTSEPIASDNWSCASPANGPITCQIDASLEPQAQWQDFTSTLITSFRTPKTFETCATASATGQSAKACWSTETPRLHLAKSAPETCAAGAPCGFTLTVTNPGPADYAGPLSISEAFRETTPPTPGLGDFTAITPPLCDIADLNAGLCAGSVSLPAGASQDYTLDWLPPDLGAAYPEGYAALNCATAASLAGTATGDDTPFDGIEGLACASVKVPAQAGQTGASRGGPTPELPPATDKPLLDLVKTADPCKVNTAAQSYLCRFDLTITNTGNTAFAGPIALSDRFNDAKIKTTPKDWTCAPTAFGALCDTPALQLAPQASTSLQIDLAVPGLAKGGSFDNCAALGLTDPEPSRENTALVQRILLEQGHNIGSADGVAGAKTRAAVATLQTERGLEPTGQIDPTLLTQLLPAQTAESCVTVDLPPMPAPPLVCDRASTTKTAGQCACRYAGMVRAGRSACTCTKGTTLVAGKGCVKVRTQPKTPPKTQTTTPSTQPELRFCSNGLPEIPGVGCINLNLQKRPRTVSPTCNPNIKGSCF